MRIQRKIKQHVWCREKNSQWFWNAQKSAIFWVRNKEKCPKHWILLLMYVSITKLIIAIFLFSESTVKLKDKINNYHWEDNKGQEWGWTLFRQCVRPPTCPLFFLDFSDIFRGLMILPSHIAALSLSLLIYILTLLLMMVLYYRGQIICPHYQKHFERYASMLMGKIALYPNQ